MYCNINSYMNEFIKTAGVISVLSLTNPSCPIALSFKEILMNSIKIQVAHGPSGAILRATPQQCLMFWRIWYFVNVCVTHIKVFTWKLHDTI